MDLFLQLLVDGLTLGLVYSIVALGYTLVYGILEFINFANSEIFMFGAFIGTEAIIYIQGTGMFGNIPVVFALILAIIISASMSGGLGVLVDKIAYKPIRKSPKLVAFISAIGVSFFLQDAVRIVEGVWKNNFYVTVPDTFLNRIKALDKYLISAKFVIMISFAVIAMAGITYFITRTKWGKSMRAVAQDQQTASLMGINTEKTISLTFFYGRSFGRFCWNIVCNSIFSYTPICWIYFRYQSIYCCCFWWHW
jgi:branched-chain amino acid transport system permease protein